MSKESEDCGHSLFIYEFHPIPYANWPKGCIKLVDKQEPIKWISGGFREVILGPESSQSDQTRACETHCAISKALPRASKTEKATGKTGSSTGKAGASTGKTGPSTGKTGPSTIKTESTRGKGKSEEY